MQIKDDPKQATELLGELIERMMLLLEPKPAATGTFNLRLVVWASVDPDG